MCFAQWKKKKTGMSEFSFIFFFSPIRANAQRESERTEREKKCIVTQAFVEAGTRQFKADSHMLILNIQTITESLTAQESKLTILLSEK